MAFDVIVVGVGGMGSAACWHLARRGHRVLGLERFDIPHAMGSSHGITRIIRLPYYEDPAYVPLLRRAYALWRELEAASGERLLVITGSIDAGPEDGAVFQGALGSARLHALPHEVLTGAEVERPLPRLPAPRRRTRRVPAGRRLRAQRAGDRRACERRAWRPAPISARGSGCSAGTRGPAAKAWSSPPIAGATKRRAWC